MKLNLRYNDNNTFNNKDHYICYDPSIKLLFISQMHFHNGFWYTNYGLQYRIQSLLTQNCNEIVWNEVKLKGLDYKGVITKFQQPLKTASQSNIGIVWNSGTQVKQHGLANFWTELKKLNLKY